MNVRASRNVQWFRLPPVSRRAAEDRCSTMWFPFSNRPPLLQHTHIPSGLCLNFTYVLPFHDKKNSTCGQRSDIVVVCPKSARPTRFASAYGLLRPRLIWHLVLVPFIGLAEVSYNRASMAAEKRNTTSLFYHVSSE